jgi:antitoxin (DNA-binding transcriptional repressor) of toxin-antitoxin stability system
MKMGIKEFRERISEVSMGDEIVVITHHGKRIGRYIPERTRPAEDVDVSAWAKERIEFGRKWRAATPDWQSKLRAGGFSTEEIEELETLDRCS